MKINIDEVDLKSIKLDDVKTWDYPDFCDAYISEAAFKDGTWLSDEQLEELQELVDVSELACEQLC